MLITDLVYIDNAGYHTSDYPTFLSFVQGIFTGIYGSDIYLGSDAQDGQLCAALAQAFLDTANIGASTYASFSPATAQGLGLSRGVKINGLTRYIASNSSAILTIVGQAGTVITNGIAIDSLQQKWDLPATVTIPTGGSIQVTAIAETIGDITAAAGTINSIFTPTLGWQSVINVAAATVGSPVETDAELRARQATSTANASLTVMAGTLGALGNLTGVTAVKGYENDTDVVDANGLTPHSVCFVVQGGNVTTVAQTIQLHKTPGTNTFAVAPNNVTETVSDSQGLPVIINFISPPVEAAITVVVTGGATAAYSADYATAIQTAVAAWINALGIGNRVYYTQLFPIAYLIGTAAYGTFNLETITLAKNGGAAASADVAILFDEIPYCTPSMVTVNVS